MFHAAVVFHTTSTKSAVIAGKNEEKIEREASSSSSSSSSSRQECAESAAIDLQLLPRSLDSLSRGRRVRYDLSGELLISRRLALAPLTMTTTTTSSSGTSVGESSSSRMTVLVGETATGPLFQRQATAQLDGKDEEEQCAAVCRAERKRFRFDFAGLGVK
ncbi:uncharacterized protein LOC116416143 [Nasonia vitripennis]|uniref:Uncharacterized protein n=1 Tax=Nasonia vitripennis TaxID=7425 RepID=A0A7M7Q1F1_NASVI|nr:uncharacterized protein LOC116416143 [Nasonia vitripennis]